MKGIPVPRVVLSGRTELAEVSGIGIDFVMSLTEVSGTGIEATSNLPVPKLP